MSLSRYEILKMFRNTMKHGIHYPSKNRVEILSSVHEFYYQSKSVTDPQELSERLRMAKMILANFQMYHAKMIEMRTGTKIEKPYDQSDINTPGKDFVYF
ncbi:hypothetical protein SteCoe_24311 [Stentor coeruleus]|uniref:Uncharacterized protein n=1 Tax=Stentor coeruleus TaxID=5963 RepID=A0A1R2BI84_9CILI|nr:hypothetical protein SteCoe_24311 [Stentor coeruleus]